MGRLSCELDVARHAIGTSCLLWPYCHIAGNAGLSSYQAAGVIALAPALIFQIAFIAASPEVLGEAIPVYWMIGQMGLAVFLGIYTVMLFGTFIETGAGILQGMNERIDGYVAGAHGSSLTPMSRSTIAVSTILISARLSLIGITDLVAKGYGTMAWCFLIVYLVPMLTVGVYRLSVSHRSDC